MCGWLRRRYGAGPPDPEDIAQDAFVKLSQVDDFDAIADPRAYLYTIAAHLALSGIRWLGRTRDYIDHELGATGQQLDELTPAHIADSRERFEIVLAHMQTLSDKQRQIILRSRIGGQTYEQISAETGWSIADISRQLTAALGEMRCALAQYDEDDARATPDDRRR